MAETRHYYKDTTYDEILQDLHRLYDQYYSRDLIALDKVHNKWKILGKLVKGPTFIGMKY